MSDDKKIQLSEDEHDLELFLVRHGETESNLERRYQGWTESPLSALGMRQAEEAAFFFGSRAIDCIFCSDLKRAFNTARIIGAGCGVEPVATPLLREINFGQWEGMTYEEIKKGWNGEVTRWFDDPFKRSAPGGETVEEVSKRMFAFLNSLAANGPRARRIIAVSHGGAIRAMLYRLLNLDRDSFWDLKIDNASISLVRKEGGRYLVDYYNRIDHLYAGQKGGNVQNGHQ